MLNLPMIHFFPSLHCNLRCPYCSQVDVRRPGISASSLYQDDGFLDLIGRIPRTHFFVSGGEPLIQKGLDGFLQRAGVHGHTVSFDTNGVVPLHVLEGMLDRHPRTMWGFFNITHHILAGVPFSTVKKVTGLFRRYDTPHFVKYIATPKQIPVIEQNMDTLRGLGTGVMVTILETYKVPWQGRCFPRGYTDEELLELLNMVTLKIHALQFFGGIHSAGRSCTSGCSFITYNMKNRLETTPCCHCNRRVPWEDTVFKGGDAETAPCANDICLGDVMFVRGNQGLFDEKERFAAICNGYSPRIRFESAMLFIEEVAEKSELVLQSRFEEFKAIYMPNGGRRYQFVS
ncbi:MAG: radical SAM protein [Desulfobacterales bacterium]|nr:radical SAM protein [Desulfobacterales bacterium]